MTRIISANVNGIRAAAKKGFYDWMLQSGVDVMCIQELKAQECQLDDEVFNPPDYFRYLFAAEKKGYSGVGIYCNKEPDNVVNGLGFELCDIEGRYIQADFGKLSVISLYLPSGSSSEAKQNNKFHFMEEYQETLAKMRKDKRQYIICGDWNIAHQNIDIKNWKANQKNSGFLPEERDWLTMLFDELGWVDAFRVLNQEEHQYTWWSNRGQAYANNVGWRIDYHIISPSLKDKLKAVSIYKDEKFSDHAPLIMDYDINW